MSTNSSRAGRLARFLPALVWMGFIFWLSSRSHFPRVPFEESGIDKVAHTILYCTLMTLWLWGDRGRRVGLWLALTVLYGMSDEIHQAFVPHRDPDFFDFLTDACAALAVAGVWLRSRRARAKAPRQE